MNLLRTCVGVLAALLLAGCAATAGHGSVTGHIVGRLLMEGGPLGPGGRQPGERQPGERPIPGTVTFTAAGHRRVTVPVGPSGTFSVRLPSGRYHVSGRSPRITEVSSGSVISDSGLATGTERELPCSQPLSVTVTARHTATIAVTCIVP